MCPRILLQLWAVLVLAACAPLSPPASPGQTEAEVLGSLGMPTGRYALADGARRLEFARGPFGRVTWMVDVDSAGRVTRAAQVLQEPYFAQVVDGMPRDDLLRLLG